jgi:hypothetical protein
MTSQTQITLINTTMSRVIALSSLADKKALNIEKKISSYKCTPCGSPFCS